MRSCVVIFVIISFLFIVPLLVSAAGSNEVVDDKDAKPEHTILLECQHSDYRTYIKCLKRQKRHHEHHDSGGSRSCLDECGLDLCTSTQCVHQCHTKCMKKTKETRQFITQYETVCNDNDCTSSSSGSNAAPPNITTNIDINNVIHNHVNTTVPQQPCLPPTGPGGTPGGGGGDGNQTPKPVPPGCPGYPGTPGTPGMPGGPGTSGTPGTPGFGCNPGTGYGCNTQPIQVVAQVSFGIGLSQLGGCINSYSWPCIQQAQPTTFDCSMCTNPWYKYRCDVQCYNMVQPQVAATPNQILRN